MENKRKKLLPLFLTFLKIGAFTFGGGYAMIPIIQREIVDRKKWITDEDILEIIAIAESTPGPIAINSATFVGYKVGGFVGALLATLGVILPPFFMIFAISFVYRQFSELRAIKYAFWGIRAGVLALICKALWTMYKNVNKNIISHIIMAIAFILTVIFDINVIYIIIGCAVFGLVASTVAGRKNK